MMLHNKKGVLQYRKKERKKYALCLVVTDKMIFPIDSYSERASSWAGPLNIPVPLIE